MTICADRHRRRGLASIDTHSRGFYMWMHELIPTAPAKLQLPLYCVLVAGST